MAYAFLNDTLKLTVTFNGFSNETELGSPEEPVSVDFNIYTDEATPVLIFTDIATRVSFATFTYDWTPDTVGDFIIEFVGTFEDASTDAAQEEFTVFATESEIPEGGVTLGEDYVLIFSGVLNPLYVDPEELIGIFPDATYLEIAEALHIASLDVQQILSIPDGDLPSQVLAYEYVKAAAACALSKIYGNAYLIPDSNAQSISLGDLRVEYNTTTGAQVSGNTAGSAQTWCELAASLRLSLLHAGVGFKAVVKGSRYTNPIPSREVTGFKSRSELYYDDSKPQGLLDDLA